MNLKQLRTFVLVADAGGFAEAEDRLRLSQSAATRQIQALEATYGVLLFDRVGRRISLTSAGLEFLAACRSVLREAEALEERARALGRGNAGRLRVGASPQHIEAILAGFIPRFVERHPDVELEVIEDGGSRLAEHLDRGSVHLALLAAEHTEHEGVALADAVLLAVMASGHELAASRVIDIGALAGEPIIALNRSFSSRQWLEAACRAARFKPRIIFESSAPHTLIALAVNAYGVAILPSNIPVPSALRAAVLQSKGRAIARHNIVAWNAQRFLPGYARQFAEELVVYCQTRYPGREFQAENLARTNSSQRE